MKPNSLDNPYKDHYVTDELIDKLMDNTCLLFVLLASAEGHKVD